MNKKLEILHVVNILAFILLVVYIYFQTRPVVLSIMLGLEICVTLCGIPMAYKLRNHGEDPYRKKLFKKSCWLVLYSWLFIGIYFFITYR